MFGFCTEFDRLISYCYFMVRLDAPRQIQSMSQQMDCFRGILKPSAVMILIMPIRRLNESTWDSVTTLSGWNMLTSTFSDRLARISARFKRGTNFFIDDLVDSLNFLWIAILVQHTRPPPPCHLRAGKKLINKRERKRGESEGSGGG